MPSPGSPPMGPWALLAAQPAVWKAALAGGRIINHLTVKLIPVPALQAWAAKRSLPEWRGGEFRKWMKARKRPTAKTMVRGREPRMRTAALRDEGPAFKPEPTTDGRG